MEIKEKSLLHFCCSLGIDVQNLTQNITQGKKQIQLEFKAAKDGIISIDGLDYDHNFISKELENPELQKVLIFEESIKDIPWLDNFINKNYFYFSEDFFEKYYLVNFNKTHSLPEHLNNEEFKYYISPKMAKSFNVISRDLLEQDLFYKQSIILKLLEFINVQDHEEGLKFIRITLTNAVKIFRNSSKENFNLNEKNIQRWAMSSAGIFVNDLPESFLALKSDFASAVTNFNLGIYKDNPELAFKLSLQLTKIQGLPSELSKVIFNNHDGLVDIYYSKEKTHEEVRDKPSWVTIVLITIFVLRIIAYIIKS